MTLQCQDPYRDSLTKNGWPSKVLRFRLFQALERLQNCGHLLTLTLQAPLPRLAASDGFELDGMRSTHEQAGFVMSALPKRRTMWCMVGFAPWPGTSTCFSTPANATQHCERLDLTDEVVTYFIFPIIKNLLWDGVLPNSTFLVTGV